MLEDGFNKNDFGSTKKKIVLNNINKTTSFTK